MKVTTFKEFAAEDLKIEPFLIYPIIPASGITLLHGATDAGKSALMFTLADTITRGVEFFGMKVMQAPVIYVNLDMPQTGLHARIKGSDFKPHAYLIPYVIPFDVLNEDFLASKESYTIRKLADQVGAKLIIFDTLSDLIVGKTSDDAVALGVYRVLRAWFPERAILVSHHDRKSRWSNGGYADPSDEDALGSSFWRAKAQSALHLFKRNDIMRELVHTKSHSGEKLQYPIKLVLDESGMRVVEWKQYRGQQFIDAIEDLKKAIDWTELTERDRVVRIAQKCGTSTSTVWRWRKASVSNT